MNQTVANFINQINQGYENKKHFVTIKSNSLIIHLTIFFLKKGLIQNFMLIDSNQKIKIFLKISDLKKSAINFPILNTSNSTTTKKPFKKIEINKKRNIYFTNKKLKVLKTEPLIIYVLTTPVGILTKNEALNKKKGGNLLLKIYL